VFERFTERARQVVVLAQDEARALGHPWIGTDHLLLGVLREGGVAAQALGAAGLTLDRARSAVRRVVGESSPAPTGQIPFTAEAKRALEGSLQESIRLGRGTIDPPLVLLAVLAVGSGTAACVLADCDVDTDVVVAALDDAIDPAPYRQAADAEPERSLPPSTRQRSPEATGLRFLASVEFEFENDSLETVSARMRTLGRIARDAGFELKRGKVEPVPEDDDSADRHGWTQYAP
jgi:ATP-dependent Clp protease ATP-binding subunit ClpA